MKYIPLKLNIFNDSRPILAKLVGSNSILVYVNCTIALFTILRHFFLRLLENYISEI